jgi:hypothetical protein
MLPGAWPDESSAYLDAVAVVERDGLRGSELYGSQTLLSNIRCANPY